MIKLMPFFGSSKETPSEIDTLSDKYKAQIFHLLCYNKNDTESEIDLGLSFNIFGKKKKERKDTSINFYLYEKFLEKIKSLPDEKLNRDWILIIDTRGGMLSMSHRIMEIIYQHQSKGFQVTAVVPRYANSGGSLIALACNKIYMDQYAELSPVDAQMIAFPIKDIIGMVMTKGEKASDLSHLASSHAIRGEKELAHIVGKYFTHHTPKNQDYIKDKFVDNDMTHAFPYFYKDLEGKVNMEKIPDDLNKYSLNATKSHFKKELPM